MNIKDYGLILANDEMDPKKALKLSKETAPFLDAVKLGLTATLEPGVSIFRDLNRELNHSIPLVADFKVADIGFKNKANGQWEGTNEKIVRKVIEAGADYVICHTLPGISSIQECVETAHKLGGKVLTLPYMTHEGADLIFDQPINVGMTNEKLHKLGLYGAGLKILDLDTRKRMGGWRLPYVSVSDLVISVGEDVKVDGYIGPANNPNVLGDYRKMTSKPVFTPGIGRQKKKEDLTTQEQIGNVFETLGDKSGVIVGSAIYGAENPGKAAEEFRNWRDKAMKDHMFSMKTGTY